MGIEIKCDSVFSECRNFKIECSNCFRNKALKGWHFYIDFMNNINNEGNTNE